MPALDAREALSGTRFVVARWDSETTSTNRVAADLARAGAPDGTVVGADHQTRGRGRWGRTWESEPGSSLLVSVVLRPVPPLVSLAAGLAAAEACEEVAGVDARLKWPNDVLVGQDKVGGILAEVVVGAVVVGLGLNVRWATQLPPGAAHLGPGVSRAGLLRAWVTGLDRTADLLPRYRQRCATLGRTVRVELPGAVVEGRADEVADDGCLVVAGRRIPAGDVVHLR